MSGGRIEGLLLVLVCTIVPRSPCHAAHHLDGLYRGQRLATVTTDIPSFHKAVTATTGQLVLVPWVPVQGQYQAIVSSEAAQGGRQLAQVPQLGVLYA